MIEKQNLTNKTTSNDSNCEFNGTNELHLFLHDYKSINMLQQLTSLWQLVKILYFKNSLE